MVIDKNLTREQLEKTIDWYEKRYGKIVEKRGLHNWRNLFRKPNIYEWTILSMILLAMFMGWAYSVDISLCDEFLNNLEETCEKLLDEPLPNNPIEDYPTINFSEFIFKEGKK